MKKCLIIMCLIILLFEIYLCFFHSEYNKITYIQDRPSCISIYCDKENNVEYFVMTCNSIENGITIRLNEKGEVIHCENNNY